MVVYEENYIPRFLPGLITIRAANKKFRWQEYSNSGKVYAMACANSKVFH
jgi:hypothetical protein